MGTLVQLAKTPRGTEPEPPTPATPGAQARWMADMLEDGAHGWDMAARASRAAAGLYYREGEPEKCHACTKAADSMARKAKGLHGHAAACRARADQLDAAPEPKPHAKYAERGAERTRRLAA